MDTIIKAVKHHARTRPNSLAIRQKRYGIWEPMTWRKFYNNIRAFALGLIELGLSPEDKVSIIGDNCIEWVIAELGTIGAKGVCVGIYQDMLNQEVAYMVTASDSKFFIAGDQEQVDKFIAVQDRLSGQVKRVIVWDLRGMSDYLDKYPFLMTFKDVIALGRDAHKREPERFERGFVTPTDPDDTIVMLPTSGTTGLPKMSQLTHNNFIFVGTSWEQIHKSLSLIHI